MTPANAPKPADSTSSRSSPRASSLRASSSATALRSSARRRRATASVGGFPPDRELSESDLRQEVERVVELGERGPIRVRIRSELGLRDTLRSLRGRLGRLGAVASRPVRGEHHGRRLAERRDGVGILAAPVVAQRSRDSLALLDELVRRDGKQRFGFLRENAHVGMVALGAAGRSC